jgi:hypothetical protein
MKTEVYDEKSGAAASGRQRGEGEAKSGSSKPELNKEEMMKKAQAAGTPGPAHKALDAFVGNWKADVKCSMGEGSESNNSQGTATTKWILGGRFVAEEFHGEMMGKPFTGKCLLGFDNSKQTYKCVWVDDFSTAVYTSEGKADSSNKVITLEGKADCAATGQKDVPRKQVYRVLGPDKYVLEMYNDGQKQMEITYTRQ